MKFKALYLKNITMIYSNLYTIKSIILLMRLVSLNRLGNTFAAVLL